MNALRIPVAAFAGLVLSLALFWLMQVLISGGGATLSRAESEPLIEFVRLKQETETRLRERVLPEKPEPARALPRPHISIPHKARSAAPRLSFQADFDLPVVLSGGPHLGSFAALELDSAFLPVSRTPPRYPYQAQRRGIEGWVRVSFTVTESGNVEDVIVEEADPPGIFEQAALAAVYKWKFKPRMEGGGPTRGRAEQLVEFKLHQ